MLREKIIRRRDDLTAVLINGRRARLRSASYTSDTRRNLLIKTARLTASPGRVVGGTFSCKTRVSRRRRLVSRRSGNGKHLSRAALKPKKEKKTRVPHSNGFRTIFCTSKVTFFRNVTDHRELELKTIFIKLLKHNYC